jgi:hypothetical protein
MKRLNKLIKNWTKLKVIWKSEEYRIYANSNPDYYKLIKECLKQDFISQYDFIQIKEYTPLEIQLSLLILKTDAITEEEKEYDFSLLKPYGKEWQLWYYKILKDEEDKLKELDKEYKKEWEKLERLKHL